MNKIRQARAIYYQERGKKLQRLDDMGLLKEYMEQKPKRNHNLEVFARKKGIKW